MLHPFQYIRLAEDSGVADVTKFMLEKWGLEPPKLVISVVGGAKGFDMSKWSGRWKRIMDAGLVKVAARKLCTCILRFNCMLIVVLQYSTKY